jgi:hypothetical protein
MAWSNVTAGGSSTTWSEVTAGNPYRWVGYATVQDLWGGVDFVPSVNSTHAIWSVNSGRPIALWSLSIITASGATMEGRP